MDPEQLQVLMYGIKFGGQSYGTVEASHGIRQEYGVELSEDMSKLVDMLYNLVEDAPYEVEEGSNINFGIDMVRALAVTQPESIEEAASHMKALNRIVKVPQQSASTEQIENNDGDAFEIEYLAAVVARNPYGEIYISRENFNADRVTVVHDLDEQNAVVGIEGEEAYETVQETFDWETLDSVSLAPGALKALGVSDETRESVLGRTGTFTDLLRTLNYHIGRLV